MVGRECIIKYFRFNFKSNLANYSNTRYSTHTLNAEDDESNQTSINFIDNLRILFFKLLISIIRSKVLIFFLVWKTEVSFRIFFLLSYINFIESAHLLLILFIRTSKVLELWKFSKKKTFCILLTNQTKWVLLQ